MDREEITMATLQVRTIDDQLYKALGHRAAMDNRSISQEVISILKVYLSTPSATHSGNTDDFLKMCGCWQDERDAGEIIEEIKNARRSGERFVAEIF